MKELKISIITPSFNQGKYLERTIRSVIFQNYINIEYIVIDGGSKDESVSIIKKYSEYIYYWISEKDDGQTDAINKGFKVATGDIICWINSDDILLKNSLSFVANYFLNRPDVYFLNGLTIRIDKSDKIISIGHIILSKWFQKKGSYNVSQQGMFWRKKIFDKIGYLNPTFHANMDTEFLVRIYESGLKMGRVNKPLGAIRIHDETKTKIGGDIWINDKISLSKMYPNYLFYRKKNVFFLYFILKFFNGMYLSDLIFKIKYKGRQIGDFKFDDFKYL